MPSDDNRRPNAQNALTVISAIILVASEVLAAAIAGAWAIAGLLKLGDIFFWALQAAMTGAAMMAVIAFARRALHAEPIFTGRKR